MKKTDKIAKFDWADPMFFNEQLSEEERLIRDTARDYCQEKLMPRVLEANRNERYDRDIMDEFAEMGMSVTDTYAAAGNLYSQFQSTSMVTEGMMHNMRELQGVIGLSGEESAKLMQNMMSMSGISKENVGDEIEKARILALQNGLAPKDVMQDIANISAETQGYFKGNTDQMIKASVEARKITCERTFKDFEEFWDLTSTATALKPVWNNLGSPYTC